MPRLPQGRPPRTAARRHRLFAHCASFALILFLYALTLPASARPRPRIEAEGAAVVVNRRVTLRFAAANAGASPAERARVVVERLRAQGSLSPGSIQPRREGRQWRIVLAGRGPLLFVTKADARAQRSSPKGLAMQWAARLRSALALPPLTLSAKRLTIPLGEQRALTLGGWDTGPFSSRALLDPAVLRMESRDDPRRIVLRGERPGKAVVRVRVGDAEAACVVEVRKYAGAVPTDLVAEVTGSPAAPGLVSAAAANALRRAPHEPGARLTVLSPLKTDRAVPPGESRVLTARVALKGPNYLPVTGTARVRVVNRQLEPRETAHLFYSNTPEHIRRYRTLYTATLSDGEPARIMFHHDNQRGGPTVLAVTLTNPTEHDLRVQVIQGFVPAGIDPVKAGYRAGQKFLRQWMGNQGEICTLPARSVLPLLLQRIARHETSSGIAQIRLLDPPEGAQCRVQIAGVPVNGTGFPRSALNRLDPWRHVAARPASRLELAAQDASDLIRTVYRADRVLEASYTVGKQWAFVPLGNPGVYPTLATNGDVKNNQGDYGILYRIKVTIQNPHPTPQKVQVAFASGAGPVTGVFAIGGQYHELEEVRPPEQRPLARLTLRPNETRVVTIQTVPLGGSSYPASVIVRGE